MNVYPGRYYATSAPPVDSKPCIECGKETPSGLGEVEPICFACDGADEVTAKDHALAAAFDSRAQVIRRAVLPVEHARSAVRPFGLGFGELPSSKIVQALAEDRRSHPPRLAALLVSASLCTLLGLLVLAVAAVR